MDRSPLLLCLLLVVGAPSACRAQADPDLCAQCRDNANTFFEAVQQPDEVREQADLLRAVVCPLVQDDGPATEYCDQLVDRHWGRILKAVALDDVTINGFCFGLGQCDIKTGVQPLPCEDCQAFLVGVAGLLREDFTQFFVADILKSEEFCGAADVSPDRPEEKACRDFVDLFIPLAHPFLSDLVFEHTDYLCQRYFMTCQRNMGSRES